MEKNISLFKEKYKYIKNLGFVESVRLGYSGVGFTFEKLIGKKDINENFPIPDFLGIEIKTIRFYSKRNIKLFHCEPDGKYIFENERLRNKYGIKSKKFNCKILNLKSSGYPCKFRNYFVCLEVNYQEKNIYLNFFNEEKLIDNQTFWSFDLLKEKIELKLNYLALIKAYYKEINNIDHYRYAFLTIYKKIDFNKFLQAIKNGYITIKFNINIYSTGKNAGKIHNHGTEFIINELYLKELYEEYEIIN